MRTVGELIQALQQFNPRDRVVITGPDADGYDWAWKPDFEVEKKRATSAIVYVGGTGNANWSKHDEREF
jgi:hypothetical protein